MDEAPTERRPRVLVLTSTFPRWTKDTEPPFVFELCRRLVRDFDVRVLAPHTAGAAREENMSGIEVFRYRYAPDGLEQIAYEGGILSRLRARKWRLLLLPLFFLGQGLAIRRQVARWQPDLIDAHWLVPQGLLAALMLRGKSGSALVCTSHGGDLYALRGWFWHRIHRWIMSRCDTVVMVSHAMADYVAQRYGVGFKLSIIPMGIDARTVFTPADPDDQRVDNEILFVGRLVEKKGVRHLLEAMPKILQRRADIRLTIVGGGPEQEALVHSADRLGVSSSIRFEGPVFNRELPKYYRRATLLVAPFVVAENGDQDSVGLVCAEALACGCPVIAADIGSNEVIVDGVTGRLVKTADGVDLAEKILELLNQPDARRSLAKSGRAKVLERFDWDIVAERYRRLYRETMRRCASAIG